MPIVYMPNRWFRTNHPQPMIGTPNLNHDMQTVLLWNMLAFCMFAVLIAWFRFELERTSQAMDQMHIRKASQGVSMAMILPAPGIFLAAKPAMLLLARKALLFGSVFLLWLDSDADALAHESWCSTITWSPAISRCGPSTSAICCSSLTNSGSCTRKKRS